MMRQFLLLILLGIFALPSLAQENEPTPYEIALQHIEEARVSGNTSLNLSNLGLTELPPEIGRLTNLEELYLEDNLFLTLPIEIGNLNKLEILSLRFNQLTNLPPEIGNLNNLSFLDVSNNRLTSLPHTISRLGRLCSLDIRNNQLQYLPTELMYLELLENDCPYGGYANLLAVDGNPLISLPQGVIDQGTAAILEYLRNEAWWHLQRLIAGAAGSVGIVAALVLGLRWKSRRGRKEKEKRG